MIRNYENPEGTISLINSTDIEVPVKVFTSSTTGGPIAGIVTGQANAITTMVLCNTGAPDITDETVNAVTVNIYLVRSGKSFSLGNLIINSSTIPAGETLFLSEERIVLKAGDEVWIGTSAADLLAVTVSTLAVD
jgi:hypothetical protein